MQNSRKTDAASLDALLSAAKDAIAEGWAKEYADPRSEWHQETLRRLYED